MIKDGKYYCDKCGKEIPDPENHNLPKDLYVGIKEKNGNTTHYGSILVDLCAECADDIFWKMFNWYNEKQQDRLIREIQATRRRIVEAEIYKGWENEHHKEYKKE